MAKFSKEARARVVEIAARFGLIVELKRNGEDRYDKNLTFAAPGFRAPIYISKTTARDDGTPRCFKVAFHSDEFDPVLADPAAGIREDINRNWGQNRHSSSNYRGYPVMTGNNEPVGKCFEVEDFTALERLFGRLRSTAAMPRTPSEHREADSSAATSTEARQRLQPPRQPLAQEPPSPGAAAARIDAPEPELRGLVIREPWISEILAGRKTWEMRSDSTSIRGAIALIAKGTGLIVGVAEIVDVLPDLTEADMLANVERHRISPERLCSGETARWRTAWLLYGARRLREPVPYRHPPGAVIWVRLDRDTTARIRTRLAD